MAQATATPTPNPNAVKFVLDRRFDEMRNVASAAEASTPFERAVLAVPGVVSLFGVNDFVTVTKTPEADWDPIVTAVVAAAAEHL